MKVEKRRMRRGGIPAAPLSGDTSMLDVLPYKRITERRFLQDRYDTYQTFLRVRTTDLRGLSQSDLSRIIDRLTDFCRVYLESFKLLSMTYQSDTSQQQRFWQKKLAEHQRALTGTADSEQRALLRYRIQLQRDEIRRLKWVAQSLTELTFFLVLYGESEKELEDRVKEAVRLGGSAYDFRQVQETGQLEELLHRLHNIQIHS